MYSLTAVNRQSSGVVGSLRVVLLRFNGAVVVVVFMPIVHSAAEQDAL